MLGWLSGLNWPLTQGEQRGKRLLGNEVNVGKMGFLSQAWYTEHTMTADIQIREADETDRAWITELLQAQWGSTMVVSRGTSHDASRLPALVALLHGERVGLLTYHLDRRACEIVSLDSRVEGKGVGSALLDQVKEIARQANCHRVWLITTNDNLQALRFYQKRGLTLSALYPNALEQTRKIKPHLSLLGKEGIPLRDEMELELLLTPQGEAEGP